MKKPGFQHIALHDKIADSIELLTQTCARLGQLAQMQADKIKELEQRIEETAYLTGVLPE